MSTSVGIEILGLDELSMVLRYLDWQELLKARISKNWSEAVKLVLVFPSTSPRHDDTQSLGFVISRREHLSALNWIADALPRLQTIRCRSEEFDVEDGEEPFPIPIPRRNEIRSAPLPPVSIQPIFRFRELKELSLNGLNLNGVYKSIFNLPKLESLDISETRRLRWDLKMLVGLPKLRQLRCVRNIHLTGDIESLQVLSQTLVEVCLADCEKVKGSIMSLSKMPHLEALCLVGTLVTGDIREITEHHFKKLKSLDIPDGVYGGGYMARIEHAPELMVARHRLRKRIPALFTHRRWSLALDAPQRYPIYGHQCRAAPFDVEFVNAGPRIGWRWTNCASGGACETIWLDPKPKRGTPEHAAYRKERKEIQRDVDFYQGVYTPPTKDQHDELRKLRPLDPMQQYSVTSNCFGWW